MAKSKPVCPNCGEKSFLIQQTFALKGECHPLERQRYAYYRCEKCGCECLLTTPQGKLELISEGDVTKSMAERVLKALDLPLSLMDKLSVIKQ